MHRCRFQFESFHSWLYTHWLQPRLFSATTWYRRLTKGSTQSWWRGRRGRYGRCVGWHHRVRCRRLSVCKAPYRNRWLWGWMRRRYTTDRMAYCAACIATAAFFASVAAQSARCGLILSWSAQVTLAARCSGTYAFVKSRPTILARWALKTFGSGVARPAATRAEAAQFAVQTFLAECHTGTCVLSS